MLAYVLFKDAISEEAFAGFLDALEAFSPTIEVIAIGRAFIDLGVKANQVEIRRLIAAAQHRASVGIAEGRFVATVAAQVAPIGQSLQVTKGDEITFLNRQPVSCLPIGPETIRRLDLLGIDTVGDVARLPEEDLVNLFGAEGCLMASLARGFDSQLVAGERLIEALSTIIEFDFPVEGGDQIFSEIARALEGLCTQLRQRLQMATRVRITLRIIGHASVTLALNLASPLNEASRLLRPLQDRFVALSLPGAIGSVEIALEGFVDAYARQLTLESLLPKADRLRSIMRIVQRLAVRREATSLMHVVWDDPKSRIPERRAHLQDLLCETLRRGLYLPKPIHVVADASGAPRLVRTVSGWQAVQSIIEAWEVDDDWWTSRPIGRSYYRVLLYNGALMRLFRDQRRGSWYHQNR